MLFDLPEILSWTAGLGSLAALVMAMLGARLAYRTARHAEDQERARLRELVLPSGKDFYTGTQGAYADETKSWDKLGDSGRQPGNGEQQKVQLDDEEDGDKSKVVSGIGQTSVHAGSQQDENTRFILLLIDYYAHGLTQARRNSLASLVSAGVGISTVIAGAISAIVSARSGTGVTAAVVVSLSGAITNAIGVLFHRQANRALGHMESQTQHLREDMRTDRETRKAIELIKEVSDPQLRDRLRSAIVLQLAQADLPGTPVTDSSTNGAQPADPDKIT